jgi:hypothetical protein
VPLRACAVLLDLAGKHEHRNSDQVISAAKPILLRRDAQHVGQGKLAEIKVPCIRGRGRNGWRRT